MRRARGCLRRALLIVAALLLVLVALGVLTHPGRVALKSAGLLVEFFPSAPAYPLRWFTGEPEVTEVRYELGGTEATAYVYRPADGGRHGALVFYIGVGPEHENVHVVRISKALARTGIVVMIPVSKALSEFRVVPGEEEGAVAAFEYLREQPYVDPERVGLLGVSVGGSMAAMAASDPRIAGDVRLLEMFGSYYDATDLLSSLVLRQIEVDGEWVEWQPSGTSTEIFRDTFLATLPQADRKPLVPLFDGRTREIPHGLSPRGRAAAELLVNRDPERMPGLIVALPEESREYLDAISPSSRVEGLRTELFLMHDVRDSIIPYTESVRLYDEATGARGRRLTLLDMFRHVEPEGRNPAVLLVQAGKLYGHIYTVLWRLA